MNPAASVDWVPALAVLAVGLVCGAVLAWRLFAASRTVARAGRGVSVQVRDLAGKRDALLRQLRELEDTASKRTPEQFARERYALELEAARVLLALGERGVSADTKRAKTKAARTSRPAVSAPPDRAGLRGFLWGTASTSALLLLGFLVYQSAKPREAGGSVTGDVPMGGARAGSRSTGSGEAPDPGEAQLKAALERNPNDVDAHLALARLYLGRQDFMGVWNETTRVLEKAPGNPQALAYQAPVRLAMGQAETALGMLKRALATDPNLLDGYVHIAIVYVRMGRMKEAEAAIAEGSKRFPDRAPDFRQLLADLRTQQSSMAGAAPATGEADPHAGLGTPGDGASGSRPASASSGRRVAGTVDIDPALKGTVAPGAVLFVFVRQAGVSGGPPRAVKRLPAKFPAAFELSEADAMMGEPFPDPLLIEARLDSDGDPLTRSPTDPTARLDRVKAGRSDVRLVLRQRAGISDAQ